MPINNGNMQIPKEAIEGPADQNDYTVFCGCVPEIQCSKEEKNPNKKNTNTKVKDSKPAREILSPELGIGMSIVAKNGGVPKKARNSESKGIDK